MNGRTTLPRVTVDEIDSRDVGNSFRQYSRESLQERLERERTHGRGREGGKPPPQKFWMTSTTRPGFFQRGEAVVLER